MQDANGTRFHLLLGEGDWSSCHPIADDSSALPGLEYDADREEAILRRDPFRFPSRPGNRAPTLDQRRGAGQDRYGNWYWIDDDMRTVRVQSSGSGLTSTFWPADMAAAPSGAFTDAVPAPAPAIPPRLGGLTVTTLHYLVVGAADPAGLLVFDLHAGGPPRVLRWPPEIAFAPFDMAPTDDGGFVVLDRDQRRLWMFDRHLGVVSAGPPTVVAPALADDFQSVDGGPERATAARSLGASIDLSAALAVAADPIAVEALPGGLLFVLIRPGPDLPSTIQAYTGGLPVGAPMPLYTSTGATGAPVALVAHDMAFMPAEGRGLGTLYVVSRDGNQAFSFRVDRRGQVSEQPLPAYLPMRLFGGKALVRGVEAVSYDLDDSFLPLVSQPLVRFATEATVETRVFDGRDPGCVWHRLVLDGCVPSGGAIEVASRAADDEASLAIAGYLDEPDPGPRPDGPELPFLRAEIRGTYGTLETLFQRARGRFLQLRITLRGTGAVSPRLRAMRIYYPRFSYLERYLPAAYREDRDSASFLDRFLANVEGTLTGIEDRIAAVQLLFDPRTAPGDALEWLAAWFGVAVDTAWDEAKRRLLVRRAMDFFQVRGTVRGLQLALHLALDDTADESMFDQPAECGADDAIRIVETFRTRTLAPVQLGDPEAANQFQAVAGDSQWTPAQPARELSRRYQVALLRAQGISEALATATVDGMANLPPFPIQAPGDGTASTWESFASDALGFVPSASGAADLAAWQEFLARRYVRLSALNRAYGTSVTRFDQVPLLTALPTAQAPLEDWYLFEGTVLTIRRKAHHFSVMLPVPPGRSAADYQAQADLSRRIVELEKPAHTTFDVSFYWAMFRVGEARLGRDTIVDLGGRSPELMPPFDLGQGRLGEGRLAPRPPQDASDRWIVGRDVPAGPENRSNT
jgi:phage tail-like protein